MIRALFFVGLGLLVGGIAATVVGPPGAGAGAWGPGLGLAITSAVLWGISGTMRTIQAPPAALVRKAQDEGRVALARIDALRQTGTQINDQPLCQLELTVQPAHGAAYRTILRSVIPISQLPGVQPGMHRVVVQLLPGEPDVALLDADAHAEVWSRTRIPSIAQAGDIQRPAPGGLREDGTRRKPLLGMGPKGRGWRVILFALVFALTATAVLYPYRPALSQSVYALQEHGQLHLDMREPYSVELALQALEREVGHDRVLNVRAYPEFVTIEAAVDVTGLRADDWIYRRGELRNEGPATIQPEDEREFYRASKINWNAIWQAVRGAGQGGDLHLDEQTSYYVERGRNNEIGGDDYGKSFADPQAHFSFDNGYESANYTLDAASGKVLEGP